MKVRLDQVAHKMIAYVVDQRGKRVRSMGSVTSNSFHGARAEASRKWPGIEVDKYYGIQGAWSSP